MQSKAAAGQRLIRRESLEAVSRDVGVPAHRLSEWRDRLVAGAENALKSREQSPQNDESARLTAIIVSQPWRTNCSGRRSGGSRKASLFICGGRGIEPDYIALRRKDLRRRSRLPCLERRKEHLPPSSPRGGRRNFPAVPTGTGSVNSCLEIHSPGSTPTAVAEARPPIGARRRRQKEIRPFRPRSDER